MAAAETNIKTFQQRSEEAGCSVRRERVFIASCSEQEDEVDVITAG